MDIDLNVRDKTIKLVEENIEVFITLLSQAMVFLGMTLKVQVTKDKINQISSKLKLLCFKGHDQ